MKMHCLFHALMLSAALLSAQAWAGERRPVDERRPLKPDARVSVINVSGAIEVEAWDRNELHLTGELADDVKELAISGDENRLEIEVKLPKLVGRVDDTLLKLKLPAGASLEAEGVSADISVKGLRGAVDADSVSGDITLQVASSRIEADTVSGDVTVQAPAAETRVGSVSGDVTVLGATGKLRGESVSGDLRVQARALWELDLETVSGDLDLDLELKPDAEISVETLSGEVRLALPQLPEGKIEIETFSGELESLGLPALGDARRYKAKGSGKGRLSLSSFSGDIRLKKK